MVTPFINMGAKIQKMAKKTQPQPNQKFSLLIILLTKKRRKNLHDDWFLPYLCKTRFHQDGIQRTL